MRRVIASIQRSLLVVACAARIAEEMLHILVMRRVELGASMQHCGAIGGH